MIVKMDVDFLSTFHSTAFIDLKNESLTLKNAQA